MRRAKSPLKKETVVTGSLTAGDVEHSIKVTCKPSSVIIEAQNMRSGETWKNNFPSLLLEKITSKTGNYKNFSVFVEMLCAAVTHTSDTVELELLTYADLVALKTGKKQSNPKTVGDNKKYLILTYNVQFDIVHYPLPLPYSGKMGTVELQNTVQKLQDEIDKLKEQIVKEPSSPRQHKLCCKDNIALREEIQLLKKKEKSFDLSDEKRATDTRDTKDLQNALRHLETDMIREKNKYQKALDKKHNEVRKLIDEVESLRSTNRTLTVRLRSISTELSMARRPSSARSNRYLNSSSNRSTPPSNTHHSSSRQNSANRPSRPRSAPNIRSTNSARSVASRGRERGRNMDSSRGRERGRDSGGGRSDSRESVGVFSRKRASSRGSSSGPSEVRMRARTPSPAGARFPRFDPSAYIKDKQQKINESKNTRDRQSRSRTHLPRARSTPISDRQSPSTSIYHRPPVSSVVQDIIKGNLINGRSRRSNSVSSVDSQYSNRSNQSNRSNRSNRSNQSNHSSQSNRSDSNRTKRSTKNTKSKYQYPTSGSEQSEGSEHNKENTPYLNTPAANLALDESNVSFTKDSEIAEIDARLNALQSYLRDAKNRQYIT